MTYSKPQSTGSGAEPTLGLSQESQANFPPSPSATRASATEPSPTEASPETQNDNAVNKELRRLNRALHALSACNQALAQAGSEQELLQQICDLIVRMGAYRMAWIGYALPGEAKTVTPMAYAGHEDGYLTGIVVTWSDDDSGRGPVGSAIRENQVWVVADTESDPRFAPWREAAVQRGYAALIALPLRVAGACFGALAIYSGQRGSFESSEVQLLSEMANNLAYGITAIRSQEEGRRATAALREAEAKYRQLVEEVPAISYLAEAGARGAFLYVSPQVRTILGYQQEECLADPSFWWNHLNPEDYEVARQEDTWEEGRPLRVEYRMRRQDGQEVWLRDELVIVHDPMTGKRLTRGVLIDITERRQLEEQLRNAQQLEAVGRLAGGVAHDFNNILSIIMGHGELLLASAGEDARTRSGLEQIRRAADRAASLTQQLLAFSRKQVLQPKVLDLNEAVSDVQKMLARVIGEDIELIASLHPSLMAVKADPGQVEQVLMNLAVNARDAMPEGGKLIMETSNVELNPEQARDLELAAGPYVMLKVIDTGQGMDAATLSHIFEPFFTTKPMGKGTGLGLSTVYGIVKQSGGSIEVRSDVGYGTEFSIHLPAENEAPRRPEARHANGQVTGGPETILVVEDEPDLRELTRIFLEGYGYRVLAASSAEQAMQTAGTFSEPIDLLLTDVIMPGMSGRQLAEKLLAKRPQTKIVYMTGYTDDMVVQHKVLEPGTNLLPKPFTKFDLAERVRATLDGK
ncbi:MAG TPA: ATP-binding protein [Terriglobales bacterium]|nr:ATP-binding protein [Terriglobales bacterium]